ncbi:hypothetical protein GCM10023205_22260 [Yinghuangia aomiensis]|uniref:Penicillin-binding protein transpeptidase domain-containing protein n=1 Tax=Yinghuangia aomiensis TaxID=676205 RepID=A0ABP9H0W2_9ACTN
MSSRGFDGAKGMLGAVLGLLLIGAIAVGGLVGYRALSDGDNTGNASATAPATIPVSTPPPPTPTPAPTPTFTLPSPEPSATESASASPEPADTGPGSRTIDPELQAVAEAAVGDRNIALVALNVDNGEIVAITGQNDALSGATPPGSTFKIVTSALLLSKGIVSPNGSAPCPATSNVDGQPFHNVDNMAIPGATFRQDFARSCNTAFIEQRGKIGTGDLADFSSTYFGLNSNAWQVKPGLGTVDGKVPAAGSENEKAAQMIGQGRIQMNAMTMASVVATAITGEFHQPVLVRGGPVYSTKAKLPRSVTTAIRGMMADCATSGTAKDVFRGIPGVGAKTGTAEKGGDTTDGWMVAYRGKIAVAAYAPGGASGSKAAGPAVAEFLRAVPAN